MPRNDVIGWEPIIKNVMGTCNYAVDQRCNSNNMVEIGVGVHANASLKVPNNLDVYTDGQYYCSTDIEASIK